MIDRREMETAPRDGTEILAYGPYAWDGDFEKGSPDPGWAVIIYNIDYWMPDDIDSPSGRWELVNANYYTDVMRPLFWTPLPLVSEDT